MIASKPPFQSDSVLQTLMCHVSDTPAPVHTKIERKDGARAVQAILSWCLEKDPARRYQDVSQLLTDLRCVLGGQAPVNVSVNRWNSKKRWQLCFLLVFVAMAVPYVIFQTSKYAVTDKSMRRESYTLYAQAEQKIGRTAFYLV